MAHIEKHHILKPYQHGFLKNHSCETQLINTVEEIMYYLDHETGAQIDMLVLDFSKAFDLVSQPKLVRKLAGALRSKGPYTVKTLLKIFIQPGLLYMNLSGIV